MDPRSPRTIDAKGSIDARMSAEQGRQRSLRGLLLRSGATGLLNTAVSAAAVVVLLPAIVRAVGLEVYGVWAVLLVFASIAALLELGVARALVILLARAPAEDQGHWTAAVTICSSVGVAAIAVLLLLGLHDAPFLDARWDGFARLRPWLLGCGAIVLACCLGNALVRAVFEARLRAHWVNLGFALQTLLVYSFALFAARGFGEPRSMLVASTLAYVLVMAANAVLLLRESALRPVWRLRSSGFGALARTGGRVFAAELPVAAMGPLLLLAFMHWSAAASDYAAFDLALRISALAASCLASLSIPFVAWAAASDSDGAVWREATRHTGRMLALGAAGWVVVALAGSIVIGWLIGGDGTEVARATTVMLLGAVMLAAAEPLLRTLAGRGHIGTVFAARMLMFPVGLAALFAFEAASALDRFAVATGIAYAAGASAAYAFGRVAMRGAGPCADSHRQKAKPL